MMVTRRIVLKFKSKRWLVRKESEKDNKKDNECSKHNNKYDEPLDYQIFELFIMF